MVDLFILWRCHHYASFHHRENLRQLGGATNERVRRVLEPVVDRADVNLSYYLRNDWRWSAFNDYDCPVGWVEEER